MRAGRRRWYGNVLSIPEAESNGIKIRHIHHPSGYRCRSGNMRTALFGQKDEEITFDEPTVWHELSEKKMGVWMTDLPIEQRQMDDCILHANGRCLVGGLGVGYAAVALSRRRKVREVVVVEKNADIIKLVWDATLAKAERPEKLTVVHADLFDYLKTLKPLDGPQKYPFTWALYDIWQLDGESTFHEVVVPLRALSHGVVRQVVCWNEDIMRTQLLQGMMSRRLYLSHPEILPQEYQDLPKKLITATGSPYTDWALPFWRWFLENMDKIDGDTADFVMSMYARNYGRPELNVERYLQGQVRACRT